MYLMLSSSSMNYSWILPWQCLLALWLLLPIFQSCSFCMVKAMWCLHQCQALIPTFLLAMLQSIGGTSFHASILLSQSFCNLVLAHGFFLLEAAFSLRVVVSFIPSNYASSCSRDLVPNFLRDTIESNLALPNARDVQIFISQFTNLIHLIIIQPF